MRADVFDGAEATQGRGCEHAGEDRTDDTADAVHAEGIQGVVIAELALEAGGAEVADHACHQADHQGAHRPDGAGSRGDGHKTCYHPRGDAQCAWLTVGQPLGEHPAQGRCGGGDLGHQHGHAGGAVGRSGRACVEAEPANPQHGRAHQRVTEVVRRHRRGREALALAQHQAGHQAGDTGVDVHHGAAGEVEHAPVPHQAAVAGPDHVRDRCIHQGEPDAHEDQHRGELHPLGEGTDDQRRGDDREGHLEGDEYRLGEQRRRRGQARRRHASQEGFGQAADEGIEVDYTLLHTGGIERQAIAVNHPQHTDQAGDRKALHHYREHVLGTHHTAVEQGQARDGHEQHQGCGGQHPGGVAGVEHGGCLLCQGQAGHYEGQKGS
ncbi:hypothetical protein D3C78_843140 [compost metagenome]